MYLTHEGTSVSTERFKETKPNIYKKTTANGSKPYLSYLDKLVDPCNYTYHCINKKLLILLLSLRKLRPILKLLNLKLMIESELLSMRIYSVKVILKIG